MCTAVLIAWGPATPLPPRIWDHIRERYRSAKIDDISLWPAVDDSQTIPYRRGRVVPLKNNAERSLYLTFSCEEHTDKKEKKFFLIYEEIRKGAVAKSYITNAPLIYD